MVANEEMSSEATNLYTPKYRFEKKHVTFPVDYLKWHEEAEKKFNIFNLKNLIRNLQVLQNATIIINIKYNLKNVY